MPTPFEFGVKIASKMTDLALYGALRGALSGSLYGYMSSHPDHYKNQIDEEGKPVAAPGRLGATLRGMLGGGAFGGALGLGAGALFPPVPVTPKELPSAASARNEAFSRRLHEQIEQAKKLREAHAQQRQADRDARQGYEKMSPKERAATFWF